MQNPEIKQNNQQAKIPEAEPIFQGFSEAQLKNIKRPLSELMKKSAAEYREKSPSPIVEVKDLSAFVEKLYLSNTQHFFGDYYSSVAWALDKVAKDKGYGTGYGFVSLKTGKWEGPESFKDIIVLNNNDLTVIYPCAEKEKEDKAIWWLESLFGAYEALQEKIGIRDKQVTVFLSKENFLPFTSGTTDVGCVKINKSLQISEQILTTLHELGHMLLRWLEIQSDIGSTTYPKDYRSFFEDILEEAYLDIEPLALFKANPHLVFLKGFLFALGKRKEKFVQEYLKHCLTAATDLFLNRHFEETGEDEKFPIPIPADSFFYFIATHSGKENFQCLSDIRRLIMSGKTAREAIEQTIGIAWDKIPDIWAKEIIKSAQT